MKKIDVYRELFNVLNNGMENLTLHRHVDIRNDLELLIQMEEVLDICGIDSISSHVDYRHKWYRIHDMVDVGFFGRGSDSWLYMPWVKGEIEGWFYIVRSDRFHEHSKSFRNMINELEQYKPVHRDCKGGLFFSLGTGRELNSVIDAIYDRYAAQIDEEIKQLEIEELQKQIDKLRGG